MNFYTIFFTSNNNSSFFLFFFAVEISHCIDIDLFIEIVTNFIYIEMFKKNTQRRENFHFK